MEFDLAPELGKRDKTWAENTTRDIASASLTEIRSRKRDMICYLYYNGVKTDEDFEYLNTVGDYIYPAKVRFFQIIRSKIDLQISKLTRRPLNFATIASDEKSQKENYDKKLRHYLDLFDQRIQAIKGPEIQQIQDINNQLQEIERFLQTPAESPEQAEMQNQLMAARGELTKMLVQIRTHKENIVLLTEEDEKKIDHYFRYEYKDMAELAAQKYLKKAILERDMQKKSIKAFRDQVITGKPLYFVDPCEGEKYPLFETISPLYACWSSSSPSGYIQDGSWASYTVPMSISEIIHRFGHKLDKNDIDRIKSYQSFTRDADLKTNFNHDAYYPESNSSFSYTGSSIDRKVDVTYVYWRSPRKIIWKYTPNKHVPKKHFTHIISEDEVLELKEGDFIKIRYIDDIYQGVLIGVSRDGIVVDAGPKPNQVYDVDTFKTELPLVGFTFGDLNDEPYSYIWATKDLQDLYNILMYQAELLTVLSGVKGIIMDKAQRPDDMTPNEWVYQRKMGVTWIDTMKKKFQRFPTFNQFTQYDDTLSQSIMYILDMAKSIDEMAGMIIGVPRQAIGQTVSTDQVGTNKMSIDQSALVNEVQFWMHFDLLGKALTRFMNCAREQGVIDDVITFVNSDLTRENFAMPKDFMDGKKWDCIVSNSVNELAFIEDFKQIAINERRAGGIALHDLLKVYTGNTLKEIEETLEYASQEMVQAMQTAEANKVQAEGEREMRLKEMDNRYKELDSKMKAELNNLQMQLKERELQLKAADLSMKNELANNQQQFDNQIKEREFQLKTAEVQSSVVSDDFKNRLDALKQQVDTLLGSKKLQLEDKKLDIENRKVSKMNPKSN